MRRNITTVAVTLIVSLDIGGVTANEPIELRTPDCIEARLSKLVQEARLDEAALRVEVEILDDVCGQTVQIILWSVPDGAVKAKAVVADHATMQESLLQLEREHPAWSDQDICAAVAMEETKADASELPALVELAEELREMFVSPVLQPLLIIHGLQYNIRIESGISESIFVFHAPGHPRPPMNTLHPLDSWSQQLRESLGLGCGECIDSKEQPRHPQGAL